MPKIRARIVLAIAVSLSALVAVGDAGDLNPPPGPVSPTMTPLDEIVAMISGAEGGPNVAGDPLLTSLELAPPGSIYLQVPNVPGDVTTNGFVGWIKVANYSLEASSFTTGGGGFGPLRALIVMDKATPLLFQRLANSTLLDPVKLHARTDGQVMNVYFKIELTNAKIAKITPFFGGRALIVEFVYERVEIIYIPSDPNTGQPGQPIPFCWDAMKNMPC